MDNKLSQTHSEIFYAENPATGARMEPAYYEASQNEIQNAIVKSNAAFQQYRNKTGVEKAEFLEAIASEIQALDLTLIQRAMEETGLPE